MRTREQDCYLPCQVVLCNRTHAQNSSTGDAPSLPEKYTTCTEADAAAFTRCSVRDRGLASWKKQRSATFRVKGGIKNNYKTCIYTMLAYLCMRSGMSPPYLNTLEWTRWYFLWNLRSFKGSLLRCGLQRRMCEVTRNKWFHTMKAMITLQTTRPEYDILTVHESK